MNTLGWIVDTSFSTRLTISLLHFLWQGCCGGILVFVCGKLITGTSARFRYRFNFGILLQMAACLPVTFCLLKAPENRVETIALQPSSEFELPPGSTVTEPTALPEGVSNLVVGSDDQSPSFEHPTPIAISPTAAVVRFPIAAKPTGAFETISRWITVLYLAGVVLILGRLTRGLFGGFGLRRVAKVVDDPVLLQTVQRLSAHLGLRVTPVIAWCQQITIPVVVGVVKPMVLIPVAIASGLTPNQFETLLLHELAHIRRFDPLMNLIQRIIEAILFFHPAVWFVSRRISSEREFATDDLVLAAGCERPLYADALVRAAELSWASNRRHTPNPVTTLGASGTSANEFRLRVMRLLDESEIQAPKLQLSRGGVLAVSIAIGIAGIFAWLQSDTQESTGQQIDAAQVSDQSNVTIAEQAGNDAASQAANNAGQAPNDQVKPQWGEPSNGLRARAFPVLSSMKADAVDPSQPVTKFTNPDDVAFFVEIENVGDKPATLIDPREDDAKTRDDWIAQFLFSVDFLDAKGKPIERPEVQVVDVDLLLEFGNSPFLSLDPGSTHRYLLRPAKWFSCMKARLGHDRYRAVVHYHGMPASTVNRADGYKRPIPPQLLAAAVGDVVSPQVSFEISDSDKSTKPPNASNNDPTGVEDIESDLDWTEPTRGLRSAIELIPGKAEYAHGEKVQALIHVQNVQREPITVLFVPANQLEDAVVKDAAGDPVDLGSRGSHLGRTIYARATLQYRQILTIDEGSIGIESSKNRADKFGYWPFKLVLPAGKYSIQISDGFFDTSTMPLKDENGRAIASTKNDWTGQVTPTAIPLIITPRAQPDPYEGLESLRPYPKMHDFSLDMTEKQFLAITKREGLKPRKRKENNGNRYELPADADQTVTVDFDEEGECVHIQLLRKVAAVQKPQPDRTIKVPSFVLPDHPNVMDVGVDKERNQLVSVTIEKAAVVRAWDLDSRTMKSEVTLEVALRPNSFFAGGPALSADCKQVITCLADSRFKAAGVEIWDATNGKRVKLLSMPKELADYSVHGVAWTSDLSMVAAAMRHPEFDRPSVIVWDVDSGKVSKILKLTSNSRVCSLALCDDQRWLALGDENGSVLVWDVQSGQQIFAMSDSQRGAEHPDPEVHPLVARQIVCCQFSPDGKYLAVGDMLSVKLIDANIGALMLQIAAPFRKWRPEFVFSADSKRFARIRTDDVVPIWSTETGSQLGEIPIKAKAGTFSKDGRSFVTGSDDQTKAIAVWSLADASQSQKQARRPDREDPDNDEKQETKAATKPPVSDRTIHVILRDSENPQARFEADVKIQSESAEELPVPESFKLPFARVHTMDFQESGRNFSAAIWFEFLGEPSDTRRMVIDLKLLDAKQMTIHHTWEVTSDPRADQSQKKKTIETGGLKAEPSPWMNGRLTVPVYLLPQAKVLEISLRERKADELNHFPDQPSKTDMRMTRPDGEGRFTVTFDNPVEQRKPGRWSLDPEKHQVIFQVFVKNADGTLQKKIFKRLPARETGGYRVNLQIPPSLIDRSSVSATFVTIQPDHDKWVDDFFHKGKGTSYTGLWSGDGGPFQRTSFNGEHVGWLAE